MLLPLEHAHPGAYLGGHCAMLPFWATVQRKTAKYTLKSRNQIIIKHACGRGKR